MSKLPACLIRRLVLNAALLFPALASAQSMDCHLLTSNTERLACYDSIAPRPGSKDDKVKEAVVPDARGLKDTLSTFSSSANDQQRSQGSVLNDSWELDKASKRGVFVIRPYKTLYVMPFTYTNHVNTYRSSASTERNGAVQDGLQSVEAKYQFSLKTKVLENLFGNNGDLWLGYTQSSRWQIYNQKQSRPFRETNYEPEAMLVFRTHYELFGLKGTMAGIGVNHQSNGRALPISRSWNRVVAQLGFERDDWMLMLRPWWRMPENGKADDNPGIENYVGRGEMTVARKWQSHVFSLQARHSLRGGENSRGSAQLAWSFPISGDLKGYAQVFSGYGESLIDFNHRQTAIGLGFSMADGY